MRTTLKSWWATIVSYLNPEGEQPVSVLNIQKAILKGLSRSGVRTLKATVVPSGMLVFLSEEARRVLRPQQALALREVQEEFLALAKQEGWVVPAGGPTLRIVTDPELSGNQVRVTVLAADVTIAPEMSDVTALQGVDVPVSDMVWLTQIDTGERWKLPPDRCSILGRTGSGADLEIASAQVSRAHLLLELRQDGAGYASAVRVEDLGSTGGTWVGSERLSPGQLTDIRHGDILCVADVKLRLTVTGQHLAATTESQ